MESLEIFDLDVGDSFAHCSLGGVEVVDALISDDVHSLVVSLEGISAFRALEELLEEFRHPQSYHTFGQVHTECPLGCYLNGFLQVEV
jgi:hypothetical protein